MDLGDFRFPYKCVLPPSKWEFEVGIRFTAFACIIPKVALPNQNRSLYLKAT